MTAEHRGKYRALWEHLIRTTVPHLDMTFAEIEQVLGFGLPASSRKYVAHWHGYEGSAVARAISDAGWKASLVDLNAATVRFVKADPQGGGTHRQ